MGILDILKSESGTKKTTRGFYFGHTEAEGENKSGIQNFEHYFVDYLKVLPQIANNKFIFTGRKGAGKSAVAKFIKDTSDKDPNAFSELIKYNELMVEKLIQNFNEVEGVESAIFEWLIQVRLIKLLVKNKSAIYTNEHNKLKIFLERNAGFVDIDKYQIDQITESKKMEVKIDVLRHAFGGILGKYFDAKTSKASFIKLIHPLREIIKQVISYDVHKQKEFWIIFDDLDIHFKESNKKKISELSELLRVAKFYNTDILRNSSCYVLILLRNDIKTVVVDYFADTAKIFTSYEIPIDWYDHENFKLDENDTNLKKFINKRIAINFEANNIELNKSDPWSSLIGADSGFINGKPSFKFIIDFTYYRPRDLVLILNSLSDKDFKYPISTDQVKLILKNYVRENYGELKNELSLFFEPEDLSILTEKLRQISNLSGPVTYDFLIELFTDIDSKNADEILRILCSYSILIYIDASGKLYFNYRESNDIESEDLSTMNFTLHKSIYHYFKPDRI